ncbi:MAG: tetratricopeptide repeat protein [Pseudomonadota bacterium]
MRYAARAWVALAGLLAASACSSMQLAEKSAKTPAKQNAARPAARAASGPFGSPAEQLMYQALVAEIALQRGELAIAVDNYAAVVRSTQDAAAAQRTVQIAMFARNYDAALAAAKVWAAQQPSQEDARRVLAVLYLRKGESDKAVETFASVLATKKEDLADSYYQIGALLRRELDKSVAVGVMERLVKLHPESPEAAYSLATIYMWASADDQARTQAERVLKLKPDWPDAVSLKARAMHASGDTKGAIGYLKDYLQRQPKDALVRFDYARMLVDSRRFEEARAQYDILHKQQADNEEALYALGVLSMQFKDYKEAETYFTQLFELGKRTDHAAYYLGELADQNKKYDAALTWFERVQAGEFRLDAALRAANIVQRRNGVEAARERLRSIQVFNPQERREVILAEGALLRDAKRLKDALDVYTRGLADNKDDTKLLYARALVAERLDKLDMAEADLKAILAHEPDNASVLNALGYTLADRTSRYPEALKLIAHALELQPNDPAFLDSMGWIQYRLSNFDKALEYLKKAIELANDGEIAAHLGEVLWVSGRQDEAIKVWRSARQNFSDNEALIKVMQRYGQ